MTENQESNVQTSDGSFGTTDDNALIPQHKANAIIKGVKKEMYEKGRNDLMNELKQQNALSVNPQDQSNSTQMEGIPNSTKVNVQQQPAPVMQNPEDVRRIAAEEFNRQQMAFMENVRQQQVNAEGQRIYGDLKGKFDTAKANDQTVNFDQTLKDFQQTPEILTLASRVDNSPDVLKYLSENPEKIAQLRVLPENFATNAMQRISDSIKQNQAAAAAPKMPEPLSQIRPSSVGVGNSDGASPASMYKGQY